MWVRIVPGELHCEARGMYDKMPLTLTIEAHRFLLANMDPNTWYVYNALRVYEQFKYNGTPVPTLDDIYILDCSPVMTRETFDKSIETLKVFYIKDPKWSSAIPLVAFEREADLENGKS